MRPSLQICSDKYIITDAKSYFNFLEQKRVN